MHVYIVSMTYPQTGNMISRRVYIIIIIKYYFILRIYINLKYLRYGSLLHRDSFSTFDVISQNNTIYQ